MLQKTGTRKLRSWCSKNQRISGKLVEVPRGEILEPSKPSCCSGRYRWQVRESWGAIGLRVEEWPVSAASPEVREDDYACNRRVCAPQRGERAPLDLHDNQENRQVCRAEDYHCPYLREKQRTARCDHIQQRYRCIVGRLIDVYNTISLDVDLRWVRRQGPQCIERRWFRPARGTAACACDSSRQARTAARLAAAGKAGAPGHTT